MKVLLLQKFGLWNPGDTVEVTDPEGARMTQAGQAKEMPPSTPARKNYDPSVYLGGCHPNIDALTKK